VTAADEDFAKLTGVAEPADVLLALLALPRAGIDLDELRSYLVEHADEFHGPHTTAWAKAVCLYDYYHFGDVAGR